MTRPLRHTPLLEGTLQNLFFPPQEYKYFARAHELPFVDGSSLVKSAWAADAAMLAYARRGATRMTDAQLKENFDRAGLEFRKIGDWTRPGTQAVFAHCDKFAILAFRGTEPDDLKDVVADVGLLQLPEPHHLLSLVHSGFQSSLGKVWGDVQAQVAGYRAAHPHAEICFTGHSLGAALALLAFSRFADPNASLHTFGCPRTGNGAFRDRISSNSGRGIVRYVNEEDAVAHVPTDSFFYAQTPSDCLQFDAEGNLASANGAFAGDARSLCDVVRSAPLLFRGGDLNRQAPIPLRDHSPGRYCFRLWDLV